MTPSDFRRIALALPDALESSHMGVPDFRLAGSVFATLAHQHQGLGNLMLTPAQQADCLAEAPEVYLPAPGGWGRMGVTHIRLDVTDELTLTAALATAYKLRKQKNEARKSKPRSRPVATSF